MEDKDIKATIVNLQSFMWKAQLQILKAQLNVDELEELIKTANMNLERLEQLIKYNDANQQHTQTPDQD